MNDILTQLEALLKNRKGADAGSSYVASLYAKGTDHILKKIGEEATEVVIAGKDGTADKVIYEMADLWFHSLVLLVHQGISPQAVLDELARRQGISGHVEKASRDA